MLLNVISHPGDEFTDALLSKDKVFGLVLDQGVANLVVDCDCLRGTDLPSVFCEYEHLDSWVVGFYLCSIWSK